MEEKNSFSYQYSATEREEVEKILKKYIPNNKETTKLNQIQKIDKRVSAFCAVVSILIGIAGMLVFGFGLSLILAFENTFILGIFCGIIGISIMGLNPIFNRIILEKRRSKFASEIISLSEEILRK